MPDKEAMASQRFRSELVKLVEARMKLAQIRTDRRATAAETFDAAQAFREQEKKMQQALDAWAAALEEKMSGG
jgi:hypothetical protein